VLPCDLSLITIQYISDYRQFSDIHISQGSVVTYDRCGGTFQHDFVANLPLSLPLKEFWKSVNILGKLWADSTMTSPLLCDTPYSYLLAEWSRYATSFSPSSNHRPSRDTTPWQHAFSEITERRLYICLSFKTFYVIYFLMRHSHCNGILPPCVIWFLRIPVFLLLTFECTLYNIGLHVRFALCFRDNKLTLKFSLANW